MDPKAQKKKRAANPLASTGGFDEKGAPVVIDWQYAMAELSKKNGLDPEEEIRKARERFNDEMAQKEKKLAEEQTLLEEKMREETWLFCWKTPFASVLKFLVSIQTWIRRIDSLDGQLLYAKERSEYEKQIEDLKKKGQRSSVKDKEQEQIKAESTLESLLQSASYMYTLGIRWEMFCGIRLISKCWFQISCRSMLNLKGEVDLISATWGILTKFKGKLETQRARAQWVRAAFTAGKDERFELDIRISRQQMADLQPRMVEANRIAATFGIKCLTFKKTDKDIFVSISLMWHEGILYWYTQYMV